MLRSRVRIFVASKRIFDLKITIVRCLAIGASNHGPVSIASARPSNYSYCFCSENLKSTSIALSRGHLTDQNHTKITHRDGGSAACHARKFDIIAFSLCELSTLLLTKKTLPMPYNKVALESAQGVRPQETNEKERGNYSTLYPERTACSTASLTNTWSQKGHWLNVMIEDSILQ